MPTSGPTLRRRWDLDEALERLGLRPSPPAPRATPSSISKGNAAHVNNYKKRAKEHMDLDEERIRAGLTELYRTDLPRAAAVYEWLCAQKPAAKRLCANSERWPPLPPVGQPSTSSVSPPGPPAPAAASPPPGTLAEASA